MAATPALARDTRFRFDIAAGPPATTLAAVAQASGVAIGWDTLAGVRPLHAVRGALTVAQALDRALAGTDFVAQRVGASAWRIRPRPARGQITPPRADVRNAAAPVVATTPASDIIVTGQKRPQSLGDIAGSVSVLRLDTAILGRLSTSGRAVADNVEGLSLTNLGPGRNRPFIRGVADSPFNGASQSTVAVVLDDARVTFDAPDPDLQLVDIDQVEVLKGPQGPLYGSGALGGIYHVVTRKPDLTEAAGWVRVAGEATQHGGPGGGVNAMLNLPLLDDRLAVRAVGYGVREGGWISNEGGRSDANATVIGGGRLAVRWRPAVDWTVDLSGILQDVAVRDSQYVTTSDDVVTRQVRFREPSDNDFKSAALTARGAVGGIELVGATSYVSHEFEATLDATDASAAFGFAGPTRFDDDRHYTIENYELRATPLGSGRWIAGVSYLAAFTGNRGTMRDSQRSALIERRDRHVDEVAAFAELNLALGSKIGAVVGARASYTRASDEAGRRDATEAAGSAAARRIGKPILSPSVAITWQPSPTGTFYARYARAVRPGGLAEPDVADMRRFDADELGTLDLGYRWHQPADRLSGTLSVYHTVWTDIQSDYLLANGLVSTHNAGAGHIDGIEGNADWRPAASTMLSFGASYVDARLVRSAASLRLHDTRLPITPDLTARAALARRFDLGAWSGRAFAQANYTGHARLSFDPDLDRRMGGYLTGSLGTFFSRDALTVGARLDNPFDVKGDSFAFGNPFSIRNERQYTPLQPRSVSVWLTRAW